MPNTSAPYGLQPVMQGYSSIHTGGYTEYPVNTAPTAAIGIGDPVALVGGTINSIAGTPVGGTVNGNTPVGVFMGCSYMDSKLGFVNTDYLPNSFTGLSNVKVKVLDNPNTIFKIQGNAQISGTLATAIGKIGLNVAITGVAAPSATTHVSTVAANVSTIASTSTLALRIVGFESNPSNSPTDSYPDLLVRWNSGVHAFAQGTGQ